jgi:hypothetical protein
MQRHEHPRNRAHHRTLSDCVHCRRPDGSRGLPLEDADMIALLASLITIGVLYAISFILVSELREIE